MSRQDNQSRGKASGRGDNNQRNRSSARGNAPVKSEFPSKKMRPQEEPSAKPKLKFDKTGKEIGRRDKPIKEVKKSNPEDGIRLNKYIANSGIC